MAMQRPYDDPASPAMGISTDRVENLLAWKAYFRHLILGLQMTQSRVIPQTEVAQMLSITREVSPATVQGWWNGTYFPSKEFVYDIAQAFGRPIQEVMVKANPGVLTWETFYQQALKESKHWNNGTSRMAWLALILTEEWQHSLSQYVMMAHVTMISPKLTLDMRSLFVARNVANWRSDPHRDTTLDKIPTPFVEDARALAE